jgi:hypothetical protein
VTVEVEKVQFATREIVDGLNHLLPQLSSKPATLTIDSVERMIQSEAATIFIALDEFVIVGTLTLIIFSTPTGRRSWIEDVVVDESARGAGVGDRRGATAWGAHHRSHQPSIARSGERHVSKDGLRSPRDQRVPAQSLNRWHSMELRVGFESG